MNMNNGLGDYLNILLGKYTTTPLFAENGNKESIYGKRFVSEESGREISITDYGQSVLEKDPKILHTLLGPTENFSLLVPDSEQDRAVTEKNNIYAASIRGENYVKKTFSGFNRDNGLRELEELARIDWMTRNNDSVQSVKTPFADKNNLVMDEIHDYKTFNQIFGDPLDQVLETLFKNLDEQASIRVMQIKPESLLVTKSRDGYKITIIDPLEANIIDIPDKNIIDYQNSGTPIFQV